MPIKARRVIDATLRATLFHMAYKGRTHSGIIRPTATRPVPIAKGIANGCGRAKNHMIIVALELSMAHRAIQKDLRCARRGGLGRVIIQPNPMRSSPCTFRHPAESVPAADLLRGCNFRVPDTPFQSPESIGMPLQACTRSVLREY